MANVIKIKKGLDINLKGKASDVLLNGGKSESYAIEIGRASCRERV